MPQVNPAILKWARETAGLQELETVEKLGLRAARGVPAVARLRALEAGDALPTRPMLVRMARHYHRPLLAFYLAAPPRRGDRGQDFRSLPPDHSPVDDALLDALVRDLQARQGLLISALADEEDAPLLEFVGSRSIDEGREMVLSSLRAALSFNLQDYRQARSQDDAFKLLRALAERAGVFVLLMGNLGSHHTNLDPETFRGLALADRVAPFIVINDRDHHGAWSFTLLHEFTHLLLGQTGVSGENSSRGIEKFCNDVASECLLPSSELDPLRTVANLDVEVAVEMIGKFAHGRNVSMSMVCYRLYRAGVVDTARWKVLRTRLYEHWQLDRARQREKARDAEGGPDYYVVKRHRLGGKLIEAAERLTASGVLTTSRAARILGIKAKNLQPLFGRV